MTSRSWKRDSSVMMSSVSPSAKNSCRIAAHVDERQHRDRRLLGDHGRHRSALRALGRGSWLWVKTNPKDADWTDDVLDALIADILERDIVQSLADLVAHRARNADASRLREHFEARRHVDAVAKDVVVLDDHVAQIDADPKLHPSRRRDVRVAPCHPALDLGCAQYRIGDAVELDQHAVASGLDDAAAILRDGRIDELDPMGLETRESTGLVDLH
jgi:hypothetical protein